MPNTTNTDRDPHDQAAFAKAVQQRLRATSHNDSWARVEAANADLLAVCHEQGVCRPDEGCTIDADNDSVCLVLGEGEQVWLLGEDGTVEEI